MNVPSQTAIFPWRPACWLRTTGPDSTEFLQGQFTNDLRAITYDTPAYGLWLNLKGKVLADSFVFRGAQANEYWIGSYRSPAPVVRERLESHIIADDVAIEDQTGAWSGITVFGVDSMAWITAARAQTRLPGFGFRGRRTREDHTEWVFPTGAVESVLTAFSTVPHLDMAEVERRRIASGIPVIPTDIGPGDLPNEAGLDADAISYTKGCYLGQEVMARLKSMGQVRRRLLRVGGAVSVPGSLPCPLFAGSRQVGELRSAAVTSDGGMIGLAMLSLLHVNAATPLSFAANGEDVLGLVDAP